MRHLRAWLAAWCGWTALALFFAISASLTYRSTGRSANWYLSIARSLTEWWLWALLTPIVVWLAQRFPLDRRWPWRNGAIHVLAGSALAVGKAAAERVVFAWISGFWTYWLLSTLALQFVVYAAIVAAAHGVGYYRRSREHEQLEARLAETRLQLLSMQLQPHFLFNTLNTIAELVHDDPERADSMIAALSDLLRRALDLGSIQEIPLDTELDLLSRYLDIQKTRFGERLQIHIAIDEAARSAVVPVLLLQPLVENAIRHGLAERLASGRIDIAVRRSGARLAVSVTDDGLGGGSTAQDAPAQKERLGLGNTRARLEALYGREQRLELTRAPGQGAQVSLEIPYRAAAVASV